MNIFFIFILFLLCEFGVFSVWAQAPDTSQQRLLQELESVRNPFWPLIEKKVVKIDEAVQLKPETSKPEQPPVPVNFNHVEMQLPVPDALSKITDELNKKLDLKTLTIRGLIWDTDLPQAIIDDNVVHVGDVVQGAKILSITKDGITVSNNGIKEILKISTDLSSASSNVSP